MAYKKVFEQEYKKGAIDDDSVYLVLNELNRISRKPTEEDSDLVNDDIGDMSYSSIYTKNFKIVLYIDE
jgi:hypothetical protein